MNILRRIPRRQLKLMVVLISLLLVAGSYFFGFQRLNKKAEALKKENITLTSERNELLEKNRNKETMEEEIETMRVKYNSLLDEFPSNLTQDKNIMFIYNLAKHAKMEVKVISLGENELFYSPFGYVSTPTEPTADASGAAEITQATNSGELLGYKTRVTISYSSSYDGLKQCINYINDYKDRMNVANFNAAFDQTSGILSGTMVIDFYALGGTDKPFEDAVIESVPIGTKNIFGTFEIPIVDTEDLDSEDVDIEDTEPEDTDTEDIDTDD